MECPALFRFVNLVYFKCQDSFCWKISRKKRLEIFCKQENKRNKWNVSSERKKRQSSKAKLYTLFIFLANSTHSCVYSLKDGDGISNCTLCYITYGYAQKEHFFSFFLYLKVELKLSLKGNRQM